MGLAFVPSNERSMRKAKESKSCNPATKYGVHVWPESQEAGGVFFKMCVGKCFRSK